jgi:pyruvate dehydrogenase E1 component alpha subunit
MTGQRVDGNDVLAVRDAIAAAAARARGGEGPTLVEALTYRQKGHSRTDAGAYRPPGELEEWLARDPITRFERLLSEEGVATSAELAELRERTETAVRGATERAVAWSEPDVESRFEDVFA